MALGTQSKLARRDMGWGGVSENDGEVGQAQADWPRGEKLWHHAFK